MSHLREIHNIIGKGIVKKFEVVFYGGSDEGTIEPLEIELFDAEGYRLTKKQEERVTNYFEKVIRDHYYGFAGEFSVSGSLIYEAPTKEKPNGTFRSIVSEESVVFLENGDADYVAIEPSMAIEE